MFYFSPFSIASNGENDRTFLMFEHRIATIWFVPLSCLFHHYSQFLCNGASTDYICKQFTNTSVTFDPEKGIMLKLYLFASQAMAMFVAKNVVWTPTDVYTCTHAHARTHAQEHIHNHTYGIGSKIKKYIYKIALSLTAPFNKVLVDQQV